jgi:hypothetical protein
MMKRSKLLMIGVLTAFSFLTYSPAKAATTTQTSQQNSGILSGISDWWSSLFGGSSGSTAGTTPTTGGSTGGTSNAGTSLPINGNLWFLVIAGAAIGCKVIMNNKAPETQKANL